MLSVWGKTATLRELLISCIDVLLQKNIYLYVCNLKYHDIRSKITNSELLKLEEPRYIMNRQCIHSKEITVRSDDKPWYDNELRKWSRKRDRLKVIATVSKKASDWRKYKDTRNKVNNMKKYAKDRFYNNLELALTDSYGSNRRDFLKLTRYFIKSNSSSFFHYVPYQIITTIFCILRIKKRLIA